MSASCMIGTAETLIERLRKLSAEGLNQVMILPNFDTRFDVLDQVGRHVLPYV